MITRRGFDFLQVNYNSPQKVVDTLLKFFENGIRIDDIIENLQRDYGSFFIEEMQDGRYDFYLRRYVNSISDAIGKQSPETIKELTSCAISLVNVVEEYHFAFAERNYRNFYDFLNEWKQLSDNGEFDPDIVDNKNL